MQFAIAGVILGSVYAIIAIGYTLVYGILFMINFAHGDIMMIGAFGGYFVFEALKAVPMASAADPKLNFLNAQPVISIILAFAVGMGIAAMSGYFLEKIAYRPLRGAPLTRTADLCHWRIHFSGERRTAALRRAAP